jgi:hypothetical protein
MSTKVSQKQAVLNEVQAILGSSFDRSMPARDQLSESELVLLRSNIANGIINGVIEYSKDIDAKEVAKYVSSMISNHFRKAKELNGNAQYKPDSSGTRSSDPELVELNKLLKTFSEGTSQHSEVSAAISARKQELGFTKAQLTKAKKKSKPAPLNIDALPAGLRALADSIIN